MFVFIPKKSFFCNITSGSVIFYTPRFMDRKDRINR